LQQTFCNCQKLKTFEISQWNTAKVKTLNSTFYNCWNVTTLDVSQWVTNNVTTLSQTFAECSALKTLELSNWDTSNVTTMYRTFYNCYQLNTLDVSTLNTAKVTDFGYTFYYCYNLTTLDVANFDTSSATDMRSMFYGCSNLTSLDTSKFDTSKVTGYYGLYCTFYNCSKLTTLDVSNFNTSKLTGLDYTFYGCSKLTALDVSNFDTSNVTSLRSTFYNCSGLVELPVSNFVTTKVTTMSFTFYGCSSLTSLDVSNFDTSNVTMMNSLFSHCEKLTTLDLYNWKTSKVTTMSYMFNECSSLETIFASSNYDTIKVTSSTDMFNDCTSLVGGMGTEFTPEEITVTYAHVDEGTTNPGYFTDKNRAFAVYSATDNSLRFYKSTDVPSIGDTYNNLVVTAVYTGIEYTTYNNSADVPWREHSTDITTVTVENKISPVSLKFWFAGMTELTKADVEKLNTSDVTDISSVFFNCNKLTDLDLSTWDITNVNAMTMAFANCSNLETIYANTDWNTNLPASSSMFRNCEALIGGMGTAYDSANVDGSYAHADLGTLSPGYFTDKNMHAFAVYSEDAKTLQFYYRNDTVPSVGDTYDNVTVTAVYDGATYKKLTSAGEQPWVSVRANIETVKIVDTIYPTSVSYWFQGFTALTNCDLTKMDTQNTKTFVSTFGNCSSLTEINLLQWDISKLTNMTGMFTNDTKLNAIYARGDWNENTPVSTDMFKNCTSIDGGNGTTYSADNIDGTYAHIDGGTSNPGYFRSSAFAVYSTDDNSLNFYNSYPVPSVGDTYNNLTVTDVFTGIETAEYTQAKDVPWYDYTDSIKSVKVVDTIAPVSLAYWFDGFEVMTSCNVKKINTSNVTSLSATFLFCDMLEELDVSSWNTSNVIDLSFTFAYCDGLTTLDLSNWNTSKVTKMTSLFDSCDSLVTIEGIEDWDVSKVIDMSFMWRACSDLSTLNLTKWNTSSLTNMVSIFNGCRKLVAIDVNSFDISKVISMSSIFKSCSALEELDLSNWDTSNVTSMNSMFAECNSLRTIYVSNKWNTDNVTTAAYQKDMFTNDNVLVGGAGTAYADAKVTDISYAIIDQGSYKPGYLTEKNALTAFAVYSADDNSLDFYKRETVPEVGTNFEGKTVTAVYTGIEYTNYTSMDEQPWVNYDDDVKTITIVDDNISPISTSNWFSYFQENLTSADLSKLNTTRLSNISQMFASCDNIVNINVSNWDTSNITNMSGTFRNCNRLQTIDLSDWDTSKVTNMYAMFSASKKLATIYVSDLWSTQSLTTYNDMFYGCKALAGQLGTTYTAYSEQSDVDNKMYAVIDGGTISPGYLSDKNIYTYAVYSETDNSLRFYHRTGMQIIDGSWNDGTASRKVTAVYVGFDKETYNSTTKIPWTEHVEDILTTEIVDYGIAPTSVAYWFAGMVNMTSCNVSQLDISNCTSLNGTFMKCRSLTTLDLSSWNTSNITTMESTFYCPLDTSVGVAGGDHIYDLETNSRLEELNIVGWTFSKVTSLSKTFSGLQALKTIDVSGWDISNVTTLESTFFGCCSVETLDVSKWNVKKVQSLSMTFDFCESVTTLDVSKWDVSNVTDMYYLFCNDRSLTSIDLSGWDTSNVRNMSHTFGDTGLLTLDITNFDTSRVTDMSAMFKRSHQLTEIDLSSFDTSNVTNMADMFRECPYLTTIYVSNKWTMAAVTDSRMMFNEAPCLVGGNGTKYSSSNVDGTYARVDKSGQKGYFTLKN
jgi:surface protein